MKEKLLEDWLDRLSERSFQSIFAHMLSKRGWTILHLSRHCPIEMGKDIIALDREGLPCAFQMKAVRGEKFSYNDWRSISDQINSLCYQSITHPSIKKSNTRHKSYFVINGEFEEEAIRAIGDYNRTLRNRRMLTLSTYVRGELIKWIKEDYPDIIPPEIQDTKLLLELFLENGDSYLPKEKFTNLISSFLGVTLEKKPSNNSISSLICGAALLTSIAISEFSKKKNHVAEIEAWIIYLSYIFSIVERWNLPQKYWRPQANITMEILFNLLINLCDELTERKHFMEPDEIWDSPFYKPRITYCVALMGILGLWIKYARKETEFSYLDKIRDFVLKKQNKLQLWGEAAVPQLLAHNWYLRTIDATMLPDKNLLALINSIVQANNPKANKSIPLASPYYEAKDVIPFLNGFSDTPIEDSFKGRSYMLCGLMHLFVRKNLKSPMFFLWPDISRFAFIEFQANEKWQYYLWRNEKGKHSTIFPPKRKSWNKLKKEAQECKGKKLPDIIKKYPIIFLLFLCVYPHRCTSDALRWLDSEIMKLI